MVDKWDSLDIELREKCLNHLKSRLSVTEIQALIKMATNPYFHFTHGLSLRNLIRECVIDNELPDKNWDDYYMGALRVLGEEYKIVA